MLARRKIAIIFSLILCGGASQAMAQVIDYAGLQEMFREPVTTSANGSTQVAGAVPLNMEILTAEEIRSSGARSLPELVRFLPGVDVLTMTFGQSEVGIRGYNQASSERILVLVNGRQVYTEYFGQVVWDNIPVEIAEIQQVEVIKGPNTALYGFNAVSGVINIVTTNPLMSNKKMITVRGGTHDMREVSGVINQKITDKLAVKVAAGGYKANDEFNDMEASGRSAVALKPRRRSASVDVWSQLSDDVQMQLELTKNENQRNEVIAVRVFSAGEYDAESIRGRVIADTGIGVVEADVYHNVVETDYNMIIPAGVAGIKADNQVTVAKLSNTYMSGGDHIFRVGGEYRKASHNFSSPLAPLDQGDLSYEIYSGSGLWDWQATEKLRTSVAMRYDHFKLSPDESFVSPAVQAFYAGYGMAPPKSTAMYKQSEDAISYNIGAVYDVDPHNTLRVSTARGADLPSFVEFGLQFISPDRDGDPFNPAFDTLVLVGMPSTKPSIVTNYEVGYDRKIDIIDGLFRTAFFYQYNNEMQGFSAMVVDSLGIDQAFLGNFGDSEMYGMEIGLQGVYDFNWNWFANYTYLRIDDGIRNSQNSYPFSGPLNYEDALNHHTVNAGLIYMSDEWRAGLMGQYRSGHKDLQRILGPNNAYQLVEVNDQFIANANVAYDITDKLSWHLSGTSITGKTQQYIEGDAEAVVWTGLDVNF